jgi:hypothetical protein
MINFSISKIFWHQAEFSVRFMSEFLIGYLLYEPKEKQSSNPLSSYSVGYFWYSFLLYFPFIPGQSIHAAGQCQENPDIFQPSPGTAQ